MEVNELKVVETSVYPQQEVVEFYKQMFPCIAKMVSKWGGSLQDAKDIFHDGLIVLFEKEREGKVFKISRESYLTGICKHLWVRKFSKDIARVSFDDLERTINIPTDFIPTVSTNMLKNFLAGTSKRCLDLLSAMYFDALSLKKVATQQGYSNEHSASVQKYKCIERMREQIREKSMSYEDFLE